MKIEKKVTQADLNRWFELQAQLAEMKLEEMDLRKRIFEVNFQDPKEGVNSIPLTDGYVMKGTYKIDRKIDEAMLTSKAGELIKAGIPLDNVVKMKPTLSVSEYKKLDDEKRKLFDTVLDIKPGAPSLEIVKPKR